jgi:predicted DNA-binding ribbon-helix-helix protein
MKQLNRADSALRTRNVRIGDRRTSVRLEPAFWQVLEKVAKKEGLTNHALCTKIDEWNEALSLTAAMRVFLLAYIWSGSIKFAVFAARTGNMPPAFQPRD